MNLQELIRRHQNPLQDALSGLARRLEELERQRSASEIRRSQASAEASKLRDSVDDKDKEVLRIDGERETLLGELRRLEREIREKERDLERLKGERDAVKEEAREGKKTVQAEDQRIENATREIEEAETQKARLTEKLRAARLEALQEYLRNTEQRLEELDQKGEGSGIAKKNAESLRLARNSDAKIAALCEERESWLQIVATSPPAGVRLIAAAELKRVEAKLESLFPGALSVPKHSGGDAEIEELYYVLDGQGEAILLLPIAGDTWNEIKDGKDSRKVRRALNLLWSIRSALPAGSSKAEVDSNSSVVRYYPHLSEQRLSDFAPHSFVLGSGSTVAFLLSQLPDDVREALS